MIRRVPASLWFRLVVGFAVTLFATLLGVGLYLNRVATRETTLFDTDTGEIRAARVEEIVSGYLRGRSGQVHLQDAVESAGRLYGWRIVVLNRDGTPLADSHVAAARQEIGETPGSRNIPVVDEGRKVASLLVESLPQPEEGTEPTASRIAASLNRSLLYAGLVGGLGGIALVALVSGRMLGPVRRLSDAARRLGRGDLNQRVPSPGRDELGELGRSFNTMASRLQRAEQRRRDLIADVTHELRTPLSNIQGYLEAVKDGLIEPDPGTIDTIAGQTSLLSRLVEDLKVLALAETGSLRLDRRHMSLLPIVHAAIESFAPRALAKDIELTIEAPSHLPAVEIDPERLAQVTANLVENAIVQTPEGGTVRLVVEAGPTLVRVTVEDTGPGIPPDDLKRVFDRFYRVDPSRTRSTGGAGLGLTVAKQLVEAHDGAVQARSTPGIGSQFTYELPVGRRDA